MRTHVKRHLGETAKQQRLLAFGVQMEFNIYSDAEMQEHAENALEGNPNVGARRPVPTPQPSAPRVGIPPLIYRGA